MTQSKAALIKAVGVQYADAIARLERRVIWAHRLVLVVRAVALIFRVVAGTATMLLMRYAPACQRLRAPTGLY